MAQGDKIVFLPKQNATFVVFHGRKLLRQKQNPVPFNYEVFGLGNQSILDV
jgi:hypothetical protein